MSSDGSEKKPVGPAPGRGQAVGQAVGQAGGAAATADAEDVACLVAVVLEQARTHALTVSLCDRNGHGWAGVQSG